MNEVSLKRLLDLSVLSESDPPELKSVYRAAVETLDLLTIDYQTIRDLVRLSGTSDITLHLMLMALFSSLAEGSVCLKLTPESLTAKVKPLCGGKTGAMVRAMLGSIGDATSLVHVRDESSPALFDDPREAYKPLVLVRSGEDRFLYFHKFHAAERAARAALAALLSREPVFPVQPDALSAALDAVLSEKPVCLNGAPALLNAAQKLGAVLPVLKNFVLISGGPGTGKTFIVLTLLRIAVRLGVTPDRIRIAAPTGRAAQKLTDSIQRGIDSIAEPDPRDDSLASLQGETLHRLLRYSPSRNDYLHNVNNPVPADLVVIDEASMIDIVLLGRLFEALDEKACLVMLGDRNQLPSVEAGSVLADLIPGGRTAAFTRSMADTLSRFFPDTEPPAAGYAPGDAVPALADRVVILHESYRSEERIKAIAEGINRQDPSILDRIPEWDRKEPLPESGVWLTGPAPAGESGLRDMRRILSSWADRHYGSDRAGGDSYRFLIEGISGTDLDTENPATAGAIGMILSRLDDARILTPLRTGLSGTAGINAHLMEKLGGIFDPAGRDRVFSGAPVIITKNDYDKGLFNGDVGVILRGTGGRYFGAFARMDGIRLFPVESLPAFEPSFAITVHKSQGSEYGSVFLALPEGTPERLLTTEILYTGLTRAKKLVVIHGARPLLSQAIQTRTERSSRILYT